MIQLLEDRLTCCTKDGEPRKEIFLKKGAYLLERDLGFGWLVQTHSTSPQFTVIRYEDGKLI